MRHAGQPTTLEHIRKKYYITSVTIKTHPAVTHMQEATRKSLDKETPPVPRHKKHPDKNGPIGLLHLEPRYNLHQQQTKNREIPNRYWSFMTCNACGYTHTKMIKSTAEA